MIDTVKFKIPVNSFFLKFILKKSVESIKLNHKDEQIEARFWNVPVNLGSYERGVNIFVNSESTDFIYIELSLPKYLYGHNIFLLYQSQILGVVKSFYSDLISYFGVFPNYKTWEVQRLDLCFAWKFRNDEECTQILNLLNTFDYPRKKSHKRATSLMYYGSSYSVKWYMKNPEFYNHDFKEIRKTDLNLGYNLLSIASGVLRFEVTLRKSAYDRYFDNAKLHEIPSGLLESVLKSFLSRSMQFSANELNTPFEVLEKLKSKYSPSKAFNLYTYFMTVNSDTPDNIKILKLLMSRSQIYRNNIALKKAGVYLLKPLADISSISIPSEYATSFDPAVTEL